MPYQPGPQGPGTCPRIIQGQRPVPSVSVPNVSLVEIDSVATQEIPVFLLEGLRAVMLFLLVDVCDQGIEIARPCREGPISPLPCEPEERGDLS